jgi:parallel beta-helix repeat protein
MLKPIAFLSYTTFDNAHNKGAIADFCDRLSGEVRIQTGKLFPIFRDKKDIKWGQNWNARIEQGLDSTTFLIPIVTPSYLKSKACREEYEKFKEREKRLKRNDLILPVYYIECDELEDKDLCKSNPWFKDLAARQYEDWRNLRWEPSTSPMVGLAFERLARQIKQALKGTAPKPIKTSKKIQASGGTKIQQPGEKSPAKRIPSKRVPTHIVDSMHRGDYVKVSQAIAAAKPGDRIIVRRGRYSEGLLIDKPLEIIGEGDPLDVLIEASGCAVILFKGNMGIVRNLALRQSGEGKSFAVDIQKGRLVLEDCDITSQSLSCVAIHEGADPQIRRNRIHDGKQSGVYVYNNGLGIIEDNDIFGNGYAGVAIQEGGNPTIRRNRIYDGKKGGVSVYNNGLGIIEDNDLFGNDYVGVAIQEGGNPTIRRNRIHDGKQGGVFVYKNGLGVIEDNDIFGNTYSGIEIRDSSNPTIRLNRIQDGKASGVYVHTNGLGIIEENDIFSNSIVGVQVGEGGNPQVRRNRINKNRYEAIWVHENGAGTYEENDLRYNIKGAWDIAQGCKVKRERNQE